MTYIPGIKPAFYHATSTDTLGNAYFSDRGQDCQRRNPSNATRPHCPHGPAPPRTAHRQPALQARTAPASPQPPQPAPSVQPAQPAQPHGAGATQEGKFLATAPARTRIYMYNHRHCSCRCACASSKYLCMSLWICTYELLIIMVRSA